ncbi:MAG: prepilin-type N-terminal cleavage/methylation domain-containing protein [Nitrospiraceae bacterium]|nr:prepilin-type N-terminal cleavage/methylation domain-containing protein [Nitrospiraceae bacterium]
MVHKRSRNTRPNGFTLIEILVAVAVLGIGATIFISLFSASQDLAETSRSRTVATYLAEQQLDALQRDPGQYEWPSAAIEPGTMAEILPFGADPAVPRGFTLPSVMPVDSRAYAREANFMKRFSWQAYARTPDAEAAHIELTVVVRWQEGGRDQLLALTASAHRSLLAKAGPRDKEAST